MWSQTHSGGFAIAQPVGLISDGPMAGAQVGSKSAQCRSLILAGCGVVSGRSCKFAKPSFKCELVHSRSSASQLTEKKELAPFMGRPAVGHAGME